AAIAIAKPSTATRGRTAPTTPAAPRPMTAARKGSRPAAGFATARTATILTAMVWPRGTETAMGTATATAMATATVMAMATEMASGGGVAWGDGGGDG